MTLNMCRGTDSLDAEIVKLYREPMTARLSPEAAIQAATEIVVAFLQNATISQAELPDLVRTVRAAVEHDLDGGAASSRGAAVAGDAKPVPAVPINESVHHDYIVSLEDGAQYRSLRRHLKAKYGMTPEDYRAKWNLPADYPMVAPSYAEARSEVAKRSGLGRHPVKKRATRPSR